MDNFFDPIPRDSVPVSGERPLSINYHAMKTQGDFADSVNKDFIAKKKADGKAGFTYYDKDEKRNIAMDTLTFTILEVYSGIEGTDKIGDDYFNIYSTRVLNTAKEELIVWKAPGKDPIAKGYYQDIKEKVAPGKFRIFLQCYCVELDRLVELGISPFIQQGIQEAIAEDQARQGNKIAPKGVSMFGLANDDRIKGLRWTGEFKKVNEKGFPHSGSEAMYLIPVFQCGIVQPVGNNAALHAKSVALQAQIRTDYEARKAKYAERDSQPATNTQDVSTMVPEGYAPPAGRQEPEDRYFDTPKSVPMPLPSDVLPARTDEQKRLKTFMDSCERGIKGSGNPDELTTACQKAMDAMDKAYSDLEPHRQAVLLKFDQALKEMTLDNFIRFSINKATKLVEVKTTTVPKGKPDPVEEAATEDFDALPF